VGGAAAAASSSSHGVQFTSDVDDMVWPRHCVQNTQGAQLHSGLVTHESDVLVRKGMDPDLDFYSAFFDVNHSTETE
jgi:nicotinamidase-related amidase